MHGHRGESGEMCPACGESNMNCPRCGMPKGECRCSAMTKPMAEINTGALKTMVDSGVQVTLVDARTGKFDDGRRIANALNIGPDAKDDDIQRMLQSKDAMIVCYCANMKCQASRKLATRLTTLGYKRVLEYPQGIEGWVGAGYPVTQVSK